LEAAHEKDIIHRDLKPANIKITPSGTVKVMDFGLAKMTERETNAATNPADAPTFAAATETNAAMVFGTPAYMSPEQARGTAVDKRADIWAFGVVLYQMITGRPAFDGESVSDIVASVLTKENEIDHSKC